jgi:hypothetical protein
MSGFEIRLGLIRLRGEDPRPVGSPIPDASVTTLAAARHPYNLYYPTLLRASNCTVQLLAEPCPSTAATDWQKRAARTEASPAGCYSCCLSGSQFPPSSDIPIRASVKRRDDWPLGLFAAPVAPPGPAQHVSSIHHSSQQPLPCLHSGPSCATRVQTTKLPPTRTSAPAPGFGPQSSSPSPMCTIHSPPCSARVLSHGQPALPAFSSRTTMWSLPLPFRTRPTCK